jgi:hypothetical protein
MKYVKYMLMIIALSGQSIMLGMEVGEFKPLALDKENINNATSAYIKGNADKFKELFSKMNAESQRNVLKYILVYPLGDRSKNDSYNDIFKKLLPLFSDEDITYLLSLAEELKFEGKKQILLGYLAQKELEKQQKMQSEWSTIQSERLQHGMQYRSSSYTPEELKKINRK